MMEAILILTFCFAISYIALSERISRVTERIDKFLKYYEEDGWMHK